MLVAPPIGTTATRAAGRSRPARRASVSTATRSLSPSTSTVVARTRPVWLTVQAGDVVQLRDQRTSLGVGAREVDGAAVLVAGLLDPAAARQQFGARGVEVAVPVEVEVVEDRQAGVGPVELGDGDGAVQLDDR